MMNLKDIQELIKFVAKSGATEVDLEFDNVKISIKSPPKKRRGEKEGLITFPFSFPRSSREERGNFPSHKPRTPTNNEVK